jgi:TadE-like protein
MADGLKRGERGSTFVESALVLVVFLVMLISTFDVGQVLFLHQSITERIRAALRYGVVNKYDATAITDYILYGQPNAPASGSTFFSLTPDMVSVQRLDAGTADDRVVITVKNYPYEFLTPFLAGKQKGAPIIESLPYEGG